MSTQLLKGRFLRYELGLLSLKAALSTRDGEWPIYDGSRKVFQRGKAKRAFRSVLNDIEMKYAASRITEDEHVAYIETVANQLSRNLADDLHDGRFRIGVAQKLVNIHLKYLWTAGLCQEPPHCPIDGIIRDAAKLDYAWTRSDSIEEYTNAIAALKIAANGTSLSEWELQNFKRREDK